MGTGAPAGGAKRRAASASGAVATAAATTAGRAPAPARWRRPHRRVFGAVQSPCPADAGSHPPKKKKPPRPPGTQTHRHTHTTTPPTNSDNNKNNVGGTTSARLHGGGLTKGHKPLPPPTPHSPLLHSPPSTPTGNRAAGASNGARGGAGHSARVATGRAKSKGAGAGRGARRAGGQQGGSGACTSRPGRPTVLNATPAKPRLARDAHRDALGARPTARARGCEGRRAGGGPAAQSRRLARARRPPLDRGSVQMRPKL